MRKLLVASMLLLLSGSQIALARNIPLPDNSGILVVSSFVFSILGDGISTSFKLSPQNVPQAGSSVPNLPLAGAIANTALCFYSNKGEFSFTTEVSGQQLVLDFKAPLPSGQVSSCSVTLLFQPQ